MVRCQLHPSAALSTSVRAYPFVADQEALDLTLSKAALMFSQKRAILNRTPSNTSISAEGDHLHASCGFYFASSLSVVTILRA